MTSLKSHFSYAQGDSLPYWFQSSFCSLLFLFTGRENFLCLQSMVAMELQCLSEATDSIVYCVKKLSLFHLRFAIVRLTILYSAEGKVIFPNVL